MTVTDRIKPKHFDALDLLGTAQIALRTTSDLVALTERVHLDVLAKLPTPSWLARTTRLTYKAVKTIPDIQYWALKPLANYASLNPTAHSTEKSAEHKNAIAALNGVFGDQLQQENNPLTTKLTVITPDQPKHSKKLVFIHGLCLDERSWPKELSLDLAAQVHADAWFVRYNTGLSIQENARQLSDALLAESDPGDSLLLVGHSMGGLVAAAASTLFNTEPGISQRRISAVITLGSPFTGATLAKLGHWVETKLTSLPFGSPFVKLTQQRSQGILDLHTGLSVINSNRATCPCFSIAGTLDTGTHDVIDSSLGDGLVTVESALAFAPENKTLTVPYTGHLKLLSSKTVYQQMRRWLDGDEI